uniref:MAP6 domain-containing protein 1 isoform X1 n=1 Tax=Podarcis muralis TaxID=64176 RepID=UPI00109FEA7F|nr:MAP6 domain-containing protein 1 isoform X1 [Podarcis muralis]
MAWPCISRVCCLARFWNQLDKSDLAVPLTIHNYSDIDEPADEGTDAAGAPPPPPPRIPTGGSTSSRPHQTHPRAPAAASLPVSASAPSLQDGLGGARKPSKKTRGGYRKEPFAAETQYQQDFQAWPVQKRDALPWIGEYRRVEAPGAPPAAAAAAAPAAPSHAAIPGGSHVYVLPAAGQEVVGSKYSGFKQVWSSSSPPGGPETSSYRHEYRPWTGAKRSRPTKTTQGFIIPEDHFAQESSYKADFKIPEMKTKFSPNPSAVFQAPSRILNV